jgi:hypothetical protein
MNNNCSKFGINCPYMLSNGHCYGSEESCKRWRSYYEAVYRRSDNSETEFEACNNKLRRIFGPDLKPPKEKGRQIELDYE